MPRKTRRKIRRKTKVKRSKLSGTHNFLMRHLDRPLTNRWTRSTTYIMIACELVFVLWWIQGLIEFALWLLLDWDKISIAVLKLFGG